MTDSVPGALLIDIRADTDRTANGIVPGSLHIPSYGLNGVWIRTANGAVRSSPAWTNGLSCSATTVSRRVLAVWTLMYLGFRRIADVIGGFEGWRQAGLPVAEAPPPRPTCELAGMRPPDLVRGDNTSRLPHLHWD